MADTDLKIKITTTADTSGAKAAATALSEVTGATKKSSDASKEQGKRVNEMGESFEKASAAGRMMGEVVTGNIGALGQFGAVIKAVGASFKANPLFMIGSLVAMMVIPVFKKLSDGWAAQKKVAEEAGKAVEESMQKAREAMAKKAQNAIVEAYQEIETAANRALASINAVSAAVIAQTDAEEAMALAQIDANDQLSAEEKIQEKLKVSTGARAKRTQSQIGVLNGQDEQANKKAAGMQDRAAGEADLEKKLGRVVDQVSARSPDKIKKELAANADQTRALFSNQREGNPNKLSTSDYMAKKAELEQNRANLEAESADAAKNYAPRLKTAQDAVDAQKEVRIKAEKEAASAATDAAEAKRNNDIKRSTLTLQESTANKTGQFQAASALPAARLADAAKSAQASTLFDVRGGVGTFKTLAEQAGNAATPKVYGDKTNPELFNAAKNLNEAAKAAQEGGTTPEEAKALVEAASALADVMAKQKVESALMKKAIETLKSQVATLNTK